MIEYQFSDDRINVCQHEKDLKIITSKLLMSKIKQVGEFKYMGIFL